jgi:acyl carrier protein
MERDHEDTLVYHRQIAVATEWKYRATIYYQSGTTSRRGRESAPRRPNAEDPLQIRQDVLAILDDVLSLKGKAAAFADTTPLLGSLPELDSMAVAAVFASIEDRFGITVEDDEVDGSTFATVGSLVTYVNEKLQGTN